MEIKIKNWIDHRIIKEVKNLLKLGIFVFFLYLFVTGMWGFWGGYHDLDLSFNMINLGLIADINRDGVTRTLQESCLSGLNNMIYGSIQTSLATLLAIIVGYIYRGKK